ncbi:hypothetical protein B4U79_17915 [Dinothrombium tinctorium]|uniref:Uncharacterized protein n=1 Tax=Dinothrombium tinctorium TaxID=1965070 RepID=A0A3S3P9K3_9ACAR|nr:hypothetical protein B4U79_17931 [Dinothrombium tinctorium]RWS14785.1 hypothetical protein B4U79_17930 [Dinothrombium tinctorium]RWS15195.1 hypothetical protein B4U79_17916 [Dinothrombium tinctorium]RWS15206.1 hypothetical protein B4U79_17915 [Dinothrombium tinctorium]
MHDACFLTLIQIILLRCESRTLLDYKSHVSEYLTEDAFGELCADQPHLQIKAFASSFFNSIHAISENNYISTISKPTLNLPNLLNYPNTMKIIEANISKFSIGNIEIAFTLHAFPQKNGQILAVIANDTQMHLFIELNVKHSKKLESIKNFTLNKQIENYLPFITNTTIQSLKAVVEFEAIRTHPRTFYIITVSSKRNNKQHFSDLTIKSYKSFKGLRYKEDSELNLLSNGPYLDNQVLFGCPPTFCIHASIDAIARKNKSLMIFSGRYYYDYDERNSLTIKNVKHLRNLPVEGEVLGHIPHQIDAAIATKLDKIFLFTVRSILYTILRQIKL